MPVTFIAEVSSNHNRDLARSFEFIDTAARIGCDAVKFQLFKVESLFAAEVLAKKEELRQRRDWELPVEFLPELANRCRGAGVQFGCTPFDLQAVDDLLPFVDFYKVASYELLWHDLLRACAATGKPVVLSTGMAMLAEVQDAVAALRQAGCRHLTLLHCVSGYPTPPSESNLAAIETLRRATGCPTGWSDHTVNPAVLCRAIHHWQASAIEFHLDLDGAGVEFAAGHCWLPNQIGPVIADVRLGFAADGDGTKAPVPVEMADRDWRADPSDGLRPLLSVRAGLS